MSKPERTKPAGRMCRRQAGFDDAGRTVWDIASGDRDRLRAWIARGGLSTSEVIGRDVVIEARSSECGIQIGMNPLVDPERIFPLEAGPGRCSVRTRHARITVEYELALEL